MTLSALATDLWEHLVYDQDTDERIWLLKTSTRQHPGSVPVYTVCGEILCRKGKIVVLQASLLACDLMEHFHTLAMASHKGVAKSLSRMKAQFWWRGLKANVKTYIRACQIYQREKYEAMKPPGHLCPLPIPSRPWVDISMNFIDVIPHSDGKETIMVVVDRLIKCNHFAHLPRNYNGLIIVFVYQEYVGKLHGMLHIIVCECDFIFLSSFWQEYMCMVGTRLCFSTTHHPQTDD